MKFLLVLILVLVCNCAGQERRHLQRFPVEEEDSIREAVFRYLVKVDEQMPPQAEGSGRPWIYCFELAHDIHDDGTAPTAEFMARFEPSLRVPPKGQCNPQSERVHKIGLIR